MLSKWEYDFIYNKSSLCVVGRDHKSKLFSKQKYGYCESLNTSGGIQCDRFISPKYLFYPIMIAILWIGLIFLTTSDFIHNQKSPRKERKMEERNKKKRICCCICKCFKYLIILLDQFV